MSSSLRLQVHLIQTLCLTVSKQNGSCMKCYISILFLTVTILPDWKQHRKDRFAGAESSRGYSLSRQESMVAGAGGIWSQWHLQAGSGES